jgi:hypothetical protein
MISWYLNDPRNLEILKEIELAQVMTNTDINPSSFFYQQLFWQTIFDFKLPNFIGAISRYFPFFLFIMLFLLLFKTHPNSQLGTIVASSSFILLSIEVLVVFLFQTFIGNLYSQIGLIFAGVLVGMAVGVWSVGKIKVAAKILLQKIYLSYITIFILLLFTLKTDCKDLSICWFGIMFVAGIVGGAIYAIINKIYLIKFKNLGFIYAFDLFGAALGALLTSSIFLPVFGLYRLLFSLSLVTILNILAINNNLLPHTRNS